MRDLPERGVGVIFAPGLEPLLEAGDGLIDVVEIEPQSFWFSGAGVDDLAAPARRIVAAAGLDRRPALVHGVGSPVGGTVGPTGDDLANLAAVSAQLDAAWVSEHLSFNRVRRSGRTATTGLMLPPVQSDVSAQLAAATIARARRVVGRPFAFETGVNYLAPTPGEWSDGRWWRTVAETAECGIVLDLHNVWCNARNGRQDLDALLAELPLERVWELHLAGGEQVDGLWLDAHSGLVDPELLAIAARVVPRLPALRAIVFEIVPEYLVARDVGPGALREMLGSLHRLWDARRPEPADAGTGPAPEVAPPPDLAAVAEAEVALAAAVTGSGRPSDPANVVVMRRLVEAVRRGLAVTVLPLSLRLLRLTGGSEAVEEAFRACWRDHPPELFADAEAAHLAASLRNRFASVPHLGEVLDYELALVALARTGTAEPVAFSCEPTALLRALGRGERPTPGPAGSYELALVGR